MVDKNWLNFQEKQTQKTKMEEDALQESDFDFFSLPWIEELALLMKQDSNEYTGEERLLVAMVIA